MLFVVYGGEYIRLVKGFETSIPVRINIFQFTLPKTKRQGRRNTIVIWTLHRPGLRKRTNLKAGVQCFLIGCQHQAVWEFSNVIPFLDLLLLFQLKGGFLRRESESLKLALHPSLHLNHLLFSKKLSPLVRHRKLCNYVIQSRIISSYSVRDHVRYRGSSQNERLYDTSK